MGQADAQYVITASLWTDSPVRSLKMAQVGSGFVRVPYPRRFDMPASKTIENDTEEAEIYSLSALHQLHCLV